MTVKEIFEILNEYAPKRLSDEYCQAFDGYDNSGVLVDTGKDVKRVLFSLDFSFAAVEKAVKIGANLIVTHHPAIYAKIGSIGATENDLIGRKLTRCIENGISIISMHLNLDTCVGGVDECLKEGVLRAAACFDGKRTGDETMQSLNGGGYGRAYDVSPISLKSLAAGIEKEFSTKRLLVYGDGEKTVKRVASFCGGGSDEESVNYAVEKGADVILSSDFKHHVVLYAIERGLAVIGMTHYASENYGMKKYYEIMSQRVGVSCEYHTDEYLL